MHEGNEYRQHWTPSEQMPRNLRVGHVEGSSMFCSEGAWELLLHAADTLASPVHNTGRNDDQQQIYAAPVAKRNRIAN